MKTTVIHVKSIGWKERKAPDVVRIDRLTKWGNPFKIGKDGTREEVIEKYRAYIQTRPDLLAAIPSLKGKRLMCWCAPLACHGDILAELANADDSAPEVS